MAESTSIDQVGTSPVAVVTGGSAGLGLRIVERLLREGYHVVIVGRSEDRLRLAVETLAKLNQGSVSFQVADVSHSQDVQDLFSQVSAKQGRLDVLVNCVGQSDRGRIEDLTADRVEELMRQNVITALLCCQVALPMLRVSRGVIVNIGSLAAKVSPRYLGGYSIAKHALAAMTAQLRLEQREHGVCVSLLSPGPIRRDDAGKRYDDRAANLPEQARRPGGGTRVSGLTPEVVADEVWKCISKRKPDVVLPKYLRLLIGIGHTLPRLGDWLLMKFTSEK